MNIYTLPQRSPYNTLNSQQKQPVYMKNMTRNFSMVHVYFCIVNY